MSELAMCYIPLRGIYFLIQNEIKGWLSIPLGIKISVKVRFTADGDSRYNDRLFSH